MRRFSKLLFSMGLALLALSNFATANSDLQRVTHCWAIPLKGDFPSEAVVVSFHLNEDGQPQNIEIEKYLPEGTSFPELGVSAVRAIKRCAPYHDVTDPHVIMTFKSQMPPPQTQSTNRKP